MKSKKLNFEAFVAKTEELTQKKQKKVRGRNLVNAGRFYIHNMNGGSLF